MLERLAVSNLAVIEKAEVNFVAGLNVLTGETGSGKSVLRGAIELVLGGRAESSAVRTGAKEARVEAEFRLEGPAQAPVDAILGEAGVPACEGGVLLIRRTIGAEGTSRVWVNDARTTVTTLKRLAAALVDVHGPRANQRLLEERFQRATLDRYGAVDLGAYKEIYAELQHVREEAAALKALSTSEEECELLRFQVNELEESGITAEDDELAARHAAAAHAEEIAQVAQEATEALGGDAGASEILARLEPQFAALAKHFPEAEEWARESEDIAVRLQDLSRTIEESVSRLEVDPAAFAEMDRRLGVVNRLKRKYLPALLPAGRTLSEALNDVLEAKRKRLDDFENRERRLEELAREESALYRRVRAAGEQVTAARRAAGERLAQAVTRELRQLGFLKASFAVRLDACEPAAEGCDTVVYTLEPNPGEGTKPLEAIASSGEIARVMLALKGVLAQHDTIGTLVFDEIDANIGGETGRMVGEKMRAVAARQQVIAITHLPQSAVYGARHFAVSKSVSGGRTRTAVVCVEGEARVAEIARMLGGGSVGDIAYQHAQELLHATHLKNDGKMI